MVALAFNAQQYQPQYSAGGGLPPGRYKGIISDAEQKPTSKGDGGMLALTLKVIEGPLVGQTQIDNLNLWNKSAQAVEIANKQLSAYCHVTGQFVIADTMQLFNKPFQFEVRNQKTNPEYTEVCAVFDINGNEPGKAGAGPVVATAPQPAQPPPAQVAPASQPAWSPPVQGAPVAQPQTAWAPPAQQQQAAPSPAQAPAWGGQAASQPAWGAPS